MSDGKPIAQQLDLGQGEARTPPPQNSGGPVPAPIAASWAAPGEQLDLLGDVAERSNQARRAGRPEGATNRRNDETFDYLEARGFKAPEIMLMEVISADTKELARKLGADAIEVLKLQVKAANDLLPYKLARKPQQLEVKKGVLHMFVAGNLSPEVASAIQQNQMLSLDDVVRETDNVSHDMKEVQQDQGLDGAGAAVLKSAGED